VDKNVAEFERHKVVCPFGQRGESHCCRVCFNIFGSRQELLDHQQSTKHGATTFHPPRGGARWRCTVNGCGASFDREYLLRKHRKYHEKAFKCPERGCNKRFGSKAYLLNVHAKIHRGERNEKCGFCDRTFTDRSTLRNHVKAMHSPDALRVFVCRRCCKRFSKRSALQRHMKSHEKDKVALKCPGCSQTFSVQSNLNRHFRRKHGQ